MPTKEELLTAKKAYLLDQFDSYNKLQELKAENPEDYEQLMTSVPDMTEEEINEFCEFVEESSEDKEIWDWYVENTAEPEEEIEQSKKENGYTAEEQSYASQAFSWYVYEKYDKNSFSNDPNLNIIAIQNFLDANKDHRDRSEMVQMYDQVIKEARQAYKKFGLETNAFNLNLPEGITEEEFEAIDDEELKAEILSRSLEKELAELSDFSIVKWYVDNNKKQQPVKKNEVIEEDVSSVDETDESSINPIHLDVVRDAYAREFGVSPEEAAQINLPQLMEWYDGWFKEQTEEAKKEIAETEEKQRLEAEAEKLKKESEYTDEEMNYFSRAFNWYVYDKYGFNGFTSDPHLNIVQIQNFLDENNDYKTLKETVQMYEQTVLDAKKAYIKFGLETDTFDLKLPDYINEEDFERMEDEDLKSEILLESLEKELSELSESSIVKWYVDYTKKQKSLEQEKSEKEYEELLNEYPEDFENIPDENVKTDDTVVQTVLDEIQKAKEKEEIKQQEQPVEMQANKPVNEKLPDEKIPQGKINDEIVGPKVPEEEIPEEEIPEIIEIEEDDEPKQEINKPEVNKPIPQQPKAEINVSGPNENKEAKHDENIHAQVEKNLKNVFRDFDVLKKPQAVKKEAAPQNKVEEPQLDLRKYGVLLNRLSQNLNSTQGFFSRDSQEFKDLLGYMNAIGDFTALDQRQMKEALNSIDVLAGAYKEHTFNKPIDNSRRHNREGIADKLLGVVEDFRSKGTKKYADSIIARDRCFSVLDREIKKGFAANGEQIAKAYSKLMVMNTLDSKSHGKRKLAEYDSQVVEIWTEKFLKTDSFRNMLRDVKGIKAMIEDYKSNPGLLRTSLETKQSEKLLNDMAKERGIIDKLADKPKEKAKAPVAKGPGMNL